MNQSANPQTPSKTPIDRQDAPGQAQVDRKPEADQQEIRQLEKQKRSAKPVAAGNRKSAAPESTPTKVAKQQQDTDYDLKPVLQKSANPDLKKQAPHSHPA